MPNFGLYHSFIFQETDALESLEKNIFDQFEELKFEFKDYIMDKNTTLYQFQDKLRKLENEIKDEKNSKGEAIDPVSLLYVVVLCHGSDMGATFSDGRTSHIVTELRHILALPKMKDVPVVLNASFCRTKGPNQKVTSPMGNLNAHVS